ncbi:MAG: DUF6531 domain-containing protein, partial [Bdellovibrionales bacterium]
MISLLRRIFDLAIVPAKTFYKKQFVTILLLTMLGVVVAPSSAQSAMPGIYTYTYVGNPIYTQTPPIVSGGVVTATATFIMPAGFTGTTGPTWWSLTASGLTISDANICSEGCGGANGIFDFSNGQIQKWVLEAGMLVSRSQISTINGYYDPSNQSDSALIKNPANVCSGLGCFNDHNAGHWSAGPPAAAAATSAKNSGNSAGGEGGMSDGVNNGDCVCPESASAMQPNAFVGNPINAATGNKYQSETDFAGSPNTKLSLVRAYNSLGTASSVFGFGWSGNWHRSLFFYNNQVIALRPDGRSIAFTYSSSTGGYEPDADTKERIQLIGTSGWKFTTASDTVENYTADGNIARLTSLVTRNGQTTTLSYDTNKQLQTVTGPFGHTLTFTYDAQGRVSTMKAPDNGVYTYGYDANNNLVSVKYP